MRRFAATLPAAPAASAEAPVICPTTVSAVHRIVTGEHLCYA